jgi:hypothetical protein
MKSSAATILLIVCISAALAVELRSGDSLSVTLAGAGGGIFHSPSGTKGFGDALVYASFRHLFSDHIYVRVALRGAESSSVPFIHEGYLGWTRNRFAVAGGFLADRYGTCRLYSPRTFVNPLFDTYLLWDTYGLGVRSSKQWGPFTLGGSATMNNRESVALHVTPALAGEHWRGRLLCGLRTYTLENQDNSLRAGMELSTAWPAFSAHAVAAYERYFGYGSATNVTMKPGHLWDGFFELLLTPLDALEMSGLIRGTYLKKRYEHWTVFGGMEVLWLPWQWLAVGAGFESIDDEGLMTTAPAVIVELRAAPERATLRVYGNRRQTGTSSPAFTIGATVWLDF